jgi:outer membrane protein OmpA-like peptidoglycan-associated protein
VIRALPIAVVAGWIGLAAAAHAVDRIPTGRVVSIPARIEPLRAVVRDQATRIEITETSEARAFAVPTDVLFGFDSAVLSPGGERTLRSLAPDLGDGPVTVVGHTDAKGGAAYNRRLSRRRAAAAARVLRAVAPAARFVVRGAGEREPVAPNRRGAGRARNRRVEIHVRRG